MLIKDVRDEQRFLQGAFEDLAELQDEAKGLNAQRSALNEEITKVTEITNTHAQAVQQAQEHVQKLEAAYQAYTQAMQLRAQAAAKQESLKNQQIQITSESEKLTQSLATDLPEVANPQAKRDKLEALTQENTSKHASARTQLRMLQERIKALQDDERAVTKLLKCPTCKQDVSENHKEHLREHAQEEIAKLNDELAQHQSTLEKTQANLEKLTAHKQSLRTQQQDYEAYSQALMQRTQAQQRITALNQQLQDITDQLATLQAPAETPEFDQDAFTQAKQQLTQAQAILQQSQLQLKTVQTQRDSLLATQESLKEKIQKKLEKRHRYEELRAREDWLKEVFTQAIQEIEKKVFASIHHEFSNKFTNTLFELLDQESLFGVLDETFAPQLTQDGYDVDSSSLSGGEQTKRSTSLQDYR